MGYVVNMVRLWDYFLVYFVICFFFFLISLKNTCNLKLSFDTVSQRLLGKPSILFSRLCLIAFSQLILKEDEMQSDLVSIWDWYFPAVSLWQLLSRLYICENKQLKLSERTVRTVGRSKGHMSSSLNGISTICQACKVVKQYDLGSNPNLGTLGLVKPLNKALNPELIGAAWGLCQIYFTF